MVPPLPRYHEALRLPSTHPAFASLPSLGGTVRALLLRSRRAGSAPPAGLGLISGPRPVVSTEVLGSPRFLGNPCGHVPWSPTPAGPSRSAAAARGCCFPLCVQRQLPRLTFRGSIPRPAPSLSTLRRVSRPTTTQDSLPAAGQLCRAGLGTRRVPSKVSVRPSSFPGLPGANTVVIGPTLLGWDVRSSPGVWGTKLDRDRRSNNSATTISSDHSPPPTPVPSLQAIPATSP